MAVTIDSQEEAREMSREEKAAKGAAVADEVLERLLQPRFCAPYQTWCWRKWREIETRSCLDPEAANTMIWDLVLEVSMTVAPLYLEGALTQHQNLQNVLPKDMAKQHEEYLDEANDLIVKAQQACDRKQNNEARKLIERAIYLCRKTFGQEFEARRKYVAEQLKKHKEDRARRVAKKAEDRTRHAENKARRAEENRARASSGKSGIKVPVTGRR